MSASQINSHLRWFLHDAVPRPEEDIDGTLAVGAVIGSSHSKVCKLNIISQYSPVFAWFLSSRHYVDLVGLVRLFTPIEIRASGCESRCIVGNLSHIRFYITSHHPPSLPPTLCMNDDFTTRRLSPEGVIS